MANIDLHEVLDAWFEQTVRPRMKGHGFLSRVADDVIMGCEREAAAPDDESGMVVVPQSSARAAPRAAQAAVPETLGALTSTTASGVTTGSSKRSTRRRPRRGAMGVVAAASRARSAGRSSPRCAASIRYPHPVSCTASDGGCGGLTVLPPGLPGSGWSGQWRCIRRGALVGVTRDPGCLAVHGQK